MAVKTKTTVTFVDDITGATKGVETVNFAINGQAYEIDLSLANRNALERSLAKYVAAARVSPPKNTSTIGREIAPARTEIRVWARENGFSVSDRGRISFAILSAYQSAQQVTPVEAEPATEPVAA